MKRLVGSFTVSDALVPPANTRLDLTNATLLFAAGANATMLTLSNDNVTVVGGMLDGNKAGQTAGGTGVYVSATAALSMTPPSSTPVPTV